MSRWRLIIRSLLHFRAVNIAALLGVAIATACLTGAIMVGDSVRASLLDLALARLGQIDHVLVSSRFFGASLAERLKADPSLNGIDIAPGIIVRGGAARDGSDTYMPGMQLLAMGGTWAPVERGQSILNAEAADAIGASPGAQMVVSIPRDSGVPADATLARRSREDTIAGSRARVARVVTEPGMLSLFSIEGSQRAPSNIWMNLAELQDAIEQRGGANVLVVDGADAGSDENEHLNDALRRVLMLEDYGLSRQPVADGREVAFSSRWTYLDPAIETAADRVSATAGVPLRKITVNLLNSVSVVDAAGVAKRSIHYAVAAGISPLDGVALADDEVAINQWTAERLGASVGDQLAFRFYRRQSDGGLTEVSQADRGFASLRVARILPMNGIGADGSLTPAYEGLTDTDSIASWDPPEGVIIDQQRVTDADEAYWKQYRAAPKVFVSYPTALRLWGEAYGRATSIRVPAERADEFAAMLRNEIDPASVGFSFISIRQQQIAAASGTTDFGQLFVAFSFFLIVAAVLLVAMLMRLGIEQRTRQIGAMSAVGFAPAMIRGLLLREGMIVSLAGGVVGSGLAVAYTGLMITGLRTWWRGAVGTSAMRLHVEPVTLLIGLILTQAITILAIAWSIRIAGRAAPARLLAGAGTERRTRGGSAIAFCLALVFGVMGVGLVVAGLTSAIGEQAAFLTGGSMFLLAGLAYVTGSLTTHTRNARRMIHSISGLAHRNVTRHPARSTLCVALIALAAFAIVTVGGMRQGEPSDTADPNSGAGGNQLIIESDIPLLGNPATELGRTILGFRDPADPVWSRVRFMPLLRRAGQDVSCQTLTRAQSPSIVGISREMIDRGGFRFASMISRAENPWTLLEANDAAGAIPVIADASTAQYSLHLSLGDTFEVTDASGMPRQLRLVATLAGSVFQAELLMSEANFRRMYPADTGYGTVLARVDVADQDRVTTLLRDELGEYASRVRTTASVLAGFLQVQNTYLSTFQLLAALGLMLGTIGLAVVLVRTVLERRAELALLAAVGFRAASRLRLVLVENILLLLTGVTLGTISAIIGVLPALRESARSINWTSLAISLLATVLIGVAASSLAALLVGRRASAATLRSE